MKRRKNILRERVIFTLWHIWHWQLGYWFHQVSRLYAFDFVTYHFYPNLEYNYIRELYKQILIMADRLTQLQDTINQVILFFSVYLKCWNTA